MNTTTDTSTRSKLIQFGSTWFPRDKIISIDIYHGYADFIPRILAKDGDNNITYIFGPNFKSEIGACSFVSDFVRQNDL